MPDLSDPSQALRDLEARVRKLERPIALENSSIRDGRFRIIDGEIVVEGNVPIRLRQADVQGTSQAMLQFGNQTVAIYGTGEGETANLVIQAGSAILQLNDDGVHLVGADTVPAGTTAYYVVADDAGKLWTSPGIGGGGGGGIPTPGTDLGRFQWPFPLTAVTSEYGPRWGRTHEGIDFGNAPALADAPIIAAGDGVVVANAPHSGWGNYVRLTHALPNGSEVSTLYAHMVTPGLPPVGSSVKKGDVIGYVGNSGNSYGAHLHFETWTTPNYGSHINPRDFMAAYGPV